MSLNVLAPLEMSCRQEYRVCVRARSGLRRKHEYDKFRIPFSGSRQPIAAGTPLFPLEHSPERAFDPSSLKGGLGTLYAYEPSDSGGPETMDAPRRRIGKRADKHGGWIKQPARSKRRHAFLAPTASNAVSYARVRARGLRLEQVCRVTPKAPNSVPSVRTFKQAANPCWGLLSGNRLEPSMREVQQQHWNTLKPLTVS